MINLPLLLKGMISFVVGMLIFLTGVGAIIGAVGGMLFFLVGGVVSILGIGALIEYLRTRYQEVPVYQPSVITMAKHNGTWTS